ncbi:hypothetical protein G4Z16_08380 [Streptomyces bathyalis]|uniref:Uncharacterized protein n=1 Tax=Streptomyces bathyalis TaxID=2710756 RepID=A0A7T1T4U8_9ACTN|nr:hypothetical protein [Streptomyces bathyalis]QPP06411.1 hypothetical protein G4Z16_08380 [Streptomyces bathyalis]
MHYYGHEAGLLRIAEMRQKAAAERRALENAGGGHQHREEVARHSKRARRFWLRSA